MKNIVFLVLLTCSSFTLSAGNKNHVKKFCMKLGAYRQLFYLECARHATGDTYIMERSVDSVGIVVKIVGTRKGDEFDIIVMLNDSTRKLIMEQAFSMSGFRNEEQRYDTWFASWKRDELNKFIKEYFGIIIKPRRQFIKEQRILQLSKGSLQGAFFVGQRRKNMVVYTS